MTEKQKNLVTRTITGVLFVAIMVCGFLRPEAMLFLFALITGMTIWEFCGLVNEAGGVTVNRFIATVAGVYLFLAVAAIRSGIVANFVVFVRDGGATIRLDASSPIRFKHLELTSPSRVVVDLHGTWKLSEPGVPKGEMVKDVRLGKKGSDTRIVIDLHAKAKTRYILTKGKKRLDIRLDKTK